MSLDGEVWKKFINTLNEDVPEDGEGPPEIESIMKKSKAKKFTVQKIVTEIYVYTDTENQQFAEATFQDLYLLGEMTESKLNKLLKGAYKRRNREG